MFIAALAHAYAFPPKDYMDPTHPKTSFLKSIKIMFDVRDVVDDVQYAVDDSVCSFFLFDKSSMTCDSPRSASNAECQPQIMSNHHATTLMILKMQAWKCCWEERSIILGVSFKHCIWALWPWSNACRLYDFHCGSQDLCMLVLFFLLWPKPPQVYPTPFGIHKTQKPMLYCLVWIDCWTLTSSCLAYKDWAWFRCWNHFCRSNAHLTMLQRLVDQLGVPLGGQLRGLLKHLCTWCTSLVVMMRVRSMRVEVNLGT